MDISLKLIGLQKLVAAFDRVPRGFDRAVATAMRECGQTAFNESVANAPRSPTKTNKRNGAGGKLNASAAPRLSFYKRLKNFLSGKRAHKRTELPGGLEKSIEYEVHPTFATVFVARNSYAAEYARYIHDQKGIKWFNRGAGTIAKGARADHKFIARAIWDNEDGFREEIEDEIRAEMRKL